MDQNPLVVGASYSMSGRWVEFTYSDGNTETYSYSHFTCMSSEEIEYFKNASVEAYTNMELRAFEEYSQEMSEED